MCHPAAPLHRQNSSYQHLVLLHKQAPVAALYIHILYVPRVSITVRAFIGHLEATSAKPDDCVCMLITYHVVIC